MDVQDLPCDKKEFLTTMSYNFDERSIFGSSTAGTPIKRMRRSRDERKRFNNIGKKENTMIENEVSQIISPVKKSA